MQASDAEHAPGRLIVGLQAVREAIRVHGSRLYKLGAQEGDSARVEAVVRFASDHGVRVERLSRAELDRLTKGVSHQGVIASAPDLVLRSLDEVLEQEPKVVLALDGIQDPQNFGATVRSAVAMVRAAVLWGEHASAPLSPAMFRASAGAVEHASLCRVPSLAGALTQAQASGYEVVGLDAHANVALCELDLTGPCVLVVGSELTGLGRQVRRSVSSLAYLIPPHTMDSLNASVAAGAALYEVARQRRSATPTP